MKPLKGVDQVSDNRWTQAAHKPKSYLAPLLRASKIVRKMRGMRKSIHSLESKILCEKLIAMRMAAGLTHRDLAVKLKRERSFVWRIEHGERRLDLLEFFHVCQALNQDPVEVYAELVREFLTIQKMRSTNNE